ncbi:melanopsin-like [Patella vulgata]|uniref:melanopsin-like n=1 Tax=Patella vulgata TaxID=6465 RepID=UPI0024A9389E|nr:melanopsin-like [Patella vulgata]
MDTLVFVWLYSLLWSLAPVLGWSQYQLDGSRTTLTPQLSVVPQLVAKMSTVTNPILYSLSHPVVRRKLFLKLKHRMRSPISETGSSGRIEAIPM